MDRARPSASSRYQTGNGHAEEPLPADQPVAVEALDPVLVAVPHVLGHPLDLPAAGDQGLAQVGVPAAVADVPLPRGDDLERALALLEELHRVGDRPRLAVEVAGLAQQLDDPLLRAEHGLAGQLGVGARRGHARRAASARSRPSQPMIGPGGQLQLAPPGDVGEVAEGADHRDARALVRLGQAVGHDRHLDAEQRRPHGRAEQRLVALVVGVGDQRDAGGQQLGPGGLDVAPGRTGRRRRSGGRRRGARGPRARPARPPSGR